MCRLLRRMLKGDVAAAERGDTGREDDEGDGGVSSQCRLSVVCRMWCRRGCGANISERSVSDLLHYMSTMQYIRVIMKLTHC